MSLYVGMDTKSSVGLKAAEEQSGIVPMYTFFTVHVYNSTSYDDTYTTNIYIFTE